MCYYINNGEQWNKCTINDKHIKDTNIMLCIFVNISNNIGSCKYSNIFIQLLIISYQLVTGSHTIIYTFSFFIQAHSYYEWTGGQAHTNTHTHTVIQTHTYTHTQTYSNITGSQWWLNIREYRHEIVQPKQITIFVISFHPLIPVIDVNTFWKFFCLSKVYHPHIHRLICIVDE